MITKRPTKGQLQLTERQKQVLQSLFDWEKRSAKKKIIIGKPSWYDPDNPEHRKMCP